MKRRSVPMGKSKRSFTAGAMRTHPINTNPIPQRGGLRL